MSAQNLPARPLERGAPTCTAAAGLQVLSFSLGGELFAVTVAPVREIIEYQGLTPVPLTPAFIRGVINLRGAVVPVVDLSARFERGPALIGRRSCIVVAEVALGDSLHALGILVDAVNEVLEVDAAAVDPRPEFGAGIRSDFVAGMLRIKGRFVVLIELDSVLSLAELERLVAAPEGAEAGFSARRSLVVAA